MFFNVSRGATIVAALVSLAACGSQAGSVTSNIPQTSSDKLTPTASVRISGIPLGSGSKEHPSWMQVRNDLASKGLYASGFEKLAINEYAPKDPNNQGPTCSITVPIGVNGTATDGQGDLWAPEGGTTSTVVEFAPNCGSALQSLADPDGRSDGIAFNSHGTTYVSNILDQNGNAGNVVVYKTGATSPTRVLESHFITDCDCVVLGVAVDKKNNVYVTYGNYPSSQVLEFPQGKGQGIQLNLSGITYPFGITFDRNENMILVDYVAAQTEIFAPPYSGSPTRTISNLAKSDHSALNKKNSIIYFADNGNTSLDAYNYSTGAYLYSITAGLDSGDDIEGVAISPRSPN